MLKRHDRRVPALDEAALELPPAQGPHWALPEECISSFPQKLRRRPKVTAQGF